VFYEQLGDHEHVLHDFIAAVTDELTDSELNRVNQKLVDKMKSKALFPRLRENDEGWVPDDVV
jgi:hypothetical protein